MEEPEPNCSFDICFGFSSLRQNSGRARLMLENTYSDQSQSGTHFGSKNTDAIRPSHKKCVKLKLEPRMNSTASLLKKLNVKLLFSFQIKKHNQGN